MAKAVKNPFNRAYRKNSSMIIIPMVTENTIKAIHDMLKMNLLLM